MKFKLLNGVKVLGYMSSAALLSMLTVAGCEKHSGKPISDADLALIPKEGVPVSMANQEMTSESAAAKKLTDIAGQATMPLRDDSTVGPVPDYAKDFVGRYYTEVSCNDGFSPCNGGKAIFVLTLAQDGTLYRSILQHGKVFTFQNKVEAPNSTYTKDRWEMSPSLKELKVYRKEGLVLYYDVKDESTLVMNIAKTQQENQQELMEMHYKLPRISYQLTKDVRNTLP